MLLSKTNSLRWWNKLAISFVFCLISFGQARAQDSATAPEPAPAEAATEAANESSVGPAESPAEESPGEASATAAEASDSAGSSSEPSASESTPADAAATPAEPPGSASAATSPASSEDATSATTQAGGSGDWATLFTAWKNILKDLRDIRAEYNLAEDTELSGLQERWDAKIAEGNKLIPSLEAAAVLQVQSAAGSEEGAELSRFLVSLASDHLTADDYSRAHQICQGLLAAFKDKPAPARELNELAGVAAYGTNAFDLAETAFAAAAKSGGLGEQSQAMAASVAECKKLWETEQQLRDKEAAADDLPRVLLKTEVGDIVLELFENEAPDTVGNFVSLVEKGFYDGLTFHRVIHGFMAQGGCPKGDGTGGPGYSIYCECYTENHRNHFAGSLSMAKETARNTGGSQFFITLVPTPHLNGKHTVFGRVLEGMDVLPKINKTEGEQLRVAPQHTKIIQAKVLRKRSHDYVPKKVD